MCNAGFGLSLAAGLLGGAMAAMALGRPTTLYLRSVDERLAVLELELRCDRRPLAKVVVVDSPPPATAPPPPPGTTT